MFNKQLDSIFGDELEDTKLKTRKRKRRHPFELLKKFMGHPAGWITVIIAIAALGSFM